MKIGYVRVSTAEQNTARQEVLLSELSVEKMYIDKCSGANAQRTKQFMPFSALKGFSEALAERLKIRVSKIELAEDAAEELDLKLRSLEAGKIIKITYYDSAEKAYVEKVGMVSKVDATFKMIKVVDTEIVVSDLYSLQYAD